MYRGAIFADMNAVLVGLSLCANVAVLTLAKAFGAGAKRHHDGPARRGRQGDAHLMRARERKEP